MTSANAPALWLTVKLDEIASDVSYGHTASSTTEPIGPRLLRITDIQDNRVDWPNVPFCEASPQQLEKYSLQKGDLVFARTGATVGKSFLVKEKPENAIYASYLIRVRCTTEANIDYLSAFFRSPDYWQ